MLWEARKQLEGLPIEISFKWVEGHQDDSKPARMGVGDFFDDIHRHLDRRPAKSLPTHVLTGLQRHHGSLDRWARLNIECDTMAKDYWQQHHLSPLPNQRFTHERMAVSMHGKKLAQFNLKALYQEIKEPIIKEHWRLREAHVSNSIITIAAWDELWDLTDWKTHGTSF